MSFTSKIAEIEKEIEVLNNERNNKNNKGVINFGIVQQIVEKKAKLQAFKEAEEIVRKEIGNSICIDAEELKQALFGGENG